MRCEQEIWSDGEGCFCPACSAPHHHRCESPDTAPATASRCPACQCNLDNGFTAQLRAEQRRQEQHPARRLANLIFLAAVLLQLIVVVNLALVAWGTQSLMALDPTAGASIGAVGLLLLALVEVVAVALYRRRPWAWTTAVVVFALALPSMAGLVGLVLLTRPGVRQAFTNSSAGDGDEPAPGSAESGAAAQR
ncbi:MAG TPA: hypothetical protein VFE78_07805 [Gemmataceae bacterium]|nr:hypothetical protein [Gemmataceae bacterium]